MILLLLRRFRHQLCASRPGVSLTRCANARGKKLGNPFLRVWALCLLMMIPVLEFAPLPAPPAAAVWCVRQCLHGSVGRVQQLRGHTQTAAGPSAASSSSEGVTFVGQGTHWRGCCVSLCFLLPYGASCLSSAGVGCSPQIWFQLSQIDDPAAHSLNHPRNAPSFPVAPSRSSLLGLRTTYVPRVHSKCCCAWGCWVLHTVRPPCCCASWGCCRCCCL